MSTTVADLKKRQTSKRSSMTDIMKQEPKQRIKTLISQYSDQLEAALPRHLTLQRMESVCLSAALNDPKLLECYTPSLFGAMIKCSQLGLEPNNALGQAYLIPFKNTKKNRMDVQLIMGYRGMIDLARRSGNIVSLQAQAVRDGDEFVFEWGIEEKLRHVPCANRGEIVQFYAYAKLVGGGVQFDKLTREDMDTHMRTTQSKGAYGPWKDHYEQMGRKTMIRRLFNYLPVSIEMAQAMALDNTGETQVQALDNVLDDVEYQVVENVDPQEDDPVVDGNGEIFDAEKHQVDGDGQPIFNQDQSFRKRRKAPAPGNHPAEQQQATEQQQEESQEQQQEENQEQQQEDSKEDWNID